MCYSVNKFIKYKDICFAEYNLANVFFGSFKISNAEE